MHTACCIFIKFQTCMKGVVHVNKCIRCILLKCHSMTTGKDGGRGAGCDLSRIWLNSVVSMHKIRWLITITLNWVNNFNVLVPPLIVLWIVANVMDFDVTVQPVFLYYVQLIELLLPWPFSGGSFEHFNVCNSSLSSFSDHTPSRSHHGHKYGSENSHVYRSGR